MAPPYFIIESAVQHYLYLWHCGLCPQLKLNTNENGTVSINSSVSFIPFLQQNHVPPRRRRQRKRSGQASRRRRQEERTPITHSDREIAVQDESVDQLETTNPSTTEECSTSSIELNDLSPESEASVTDHMADSSFTKVYCAQSPIKCIMFEEGCTNVVSEYFNNYTAICEPCSAYMSTKLKSTPYPHNLCPCCHELSEGLPLSLCITCLEEIYQDGYAESQWGSWHIDRSSGKIVCINLNYD